MTSWQTADDMDEETSATTPAPSLTSPDAALSRLRVADHTYRATSRVMAKARTRRLLATLEAEETGVSVADIARALGMKRQSVEGMLARARTLPGVEETSVTTPASAPPSSPPAAARPGI